MLFMYNTKAAPTSLTQRCPAPFWVLTTLFPVAIFAATCHVNDSAKIHLIHLIPHFNNLGIGQAIKFTTQCIYLTSKWCFQHGSGHWHQDKFHHPWYTHGADCHHIYVPHHQCSHIINWPRNCMAIYTRLNSHSLNVILANKVQPLFG